MEIEFDPDKDVANFRKHGISLARAADFTVVGFERVYRNGETRIQAYGILDGLLYSLTFTFRRNVLRPISLRRARLKELR